MGTSIRSRALGLRQDVTKVLASAIPFILAGGSSGGSSNQFNAGAAGAITFLSALPSTFSDGAFIYLPAGTFAGQAGAGWFWYVASTTAAGTAYNNQYVSGDPIDAIPATPTAFGAGVGLVTQTVATLIDAIQFTVPGGTIGAGGWLATDAIVGVNNNANAKTATESFGGMPVSSSLASTSGRRLMRKYHATKGANRFIANNGWALTDGTMAIYPGNWGLIDSTVDQTFKYQMNLGVATDYMVLFYLDLEAVFGA